MTTSTTDSELAKQALLADMERAVPAIRARAREAERLRQLPEETVAELRETDLFRAFSPAEFGGLELGIDAVYEIGETLSRGCVSTAWTAVFLAVHVSALARFPLEAQREFLGEQGYALSAGSFHPLGDSVATPVAGGYLVSGRWDFCSGILHSDWCFFDVPVRETGEAPATRRVCAVPLSEAQVVDTWKVSGMRATGSNDLALEEVFIPEHRTIETASFHSSETPGAVAHPHFQLLHVPYYRVASVFHAAFVMGAAKRSLEIFREEVAPTRSRQAGAGPLIQSPLIHSRFAAAVQAEREGSMECESMVRRVAELYGSEAEPVALKDRALMRLSSVSAINNAARAITLLVRVSGGSMFREGGEMDRIRRDVEVLLNHNSADWDFHSEMAGRVLLGAEDSGDFKRLYRTL